MATVKETMLEMMDAAASTQTAAMMSAGDTFEGKITNMAGDTADWIGIEMEAGTTYTITVSGTLASAGMGEMDTILTLYDDKGGMIDMNDDTKEGLGSMLEFTPEVDATYYIGVSTYRNNPNLDNSGMYTVSVTGMVVDPTMGMPIPGTERVPDDTTTADENEYVSGNDKLKGTAANETINGLSGDDTLYGMGGDDVLNGGDHNDLLVGGPGADTLKGGAGQDTIGYSSSPEGVTIHLGDGTARGGDAEGDTIVDMGEADRIEHVRGSMYGDMLTGNSRGNSLWGLGGDDDLDGGRGDDSLYGGDGADNLDGGDHDDTLEGGYGADMLTGGDHRDGGGDTASYSMSMMGVTVRLHSGQSMGGDAEGDMWTMADMAVKYTDSDEEDAEVAVYDIENLTGSANADILAGDLRNNVIMGGAGDDKIYGGPSPADLDRGDDDEGLGGLTNADTLHGDGGNDMLFGGDGADTLRGGAGDDVLNGGKHADGLYGGAGSDMIHADAADTVINGWLAPYDTTTGADNTYNAPQDDTNTSDVNESLESTNDPMAVDTVSFAKVEDGVTRALNNAGEASPTATGGATITNVENIIGSQGDDTLTGNTGDNVIEGGEGGDTMDGLGGEDTLSYEGSDDWVRITLNGTAGDTSPAATTSRGHASGDTATNFENVRGSAFDDDLTGDVNANKLWGLGGDDTIEGGAGNDTIEGGAGADDLDGGYTDGDGTADGNQVNGEANTLSYAMSDAGVTVNLMTASASGGHATDDTIATYEELRPTPDDDGNEVDVATFAHVTGSKYDDQLTGDHQNNHLAGGEGDDTLRGGAGADRVIGGPGADVLDGGEDTGERNDLLPRTDTDGDGDIDDDDAAAAAASIDWAVYKHAMAGVTVDLSTNRGTGGEAMGDTLMNIELIWGSEHADTFISNGGNIIEGDGGSDTVSYEESDMGVRVDLSNTTPSGVTQHTTVAVTGTGTEASPFVFPNTDPDDTTDDAGDAVAIAGVPRLDAMGNVFSDTNVEDEDDNPNANGAAGDKLRSIENLTGSDHNDFLTGDGNPNVLKGMGGDDTLVGGASNDKLYGGAGDDTLSASAGMNEFDGGAGDDIITGGTEADKITGGAGNDDLNGGTGDDTFVFSTADAGGSDAILDYSDGDMIDLRAFELTEEQVIEAITLRGTGAEAYVVINLEAHGGGRITIDNISSLDTLDAATDDTDTTVDETTDGVIQELDTDIILIA